MSYLVIARKFRPQTFETVTGQEHITGALVNAILRDRVPHALLFTGPRGVGKTSTARVFAKALNCNGRELPTEGAGDAESVSPCGECSNCQEISKSSSLSVMEIDGASNNSVENVRELIDSLRSAPPPSSKYKIYIIDEVHMLSTAAFNALLKSLEEPPANTIFIFATTEPHKIPETVISRCQRHDFRRISLDDISQRLREIAETEKVECEEEVFTFVARLAEGGMRDAQSMFDRLIAFSSGKLQLSSAEQVFGVVDSSFFMELSEAVLLGNSEKCFQMLDKVFQHSLDVRTFLSDFLTNWRNLLLLKVSLESSGGEVAQKLLRLTAAELEKGTRVVESASAFQMQRLFDIAEESVRKAVLSNHPRYVLESGLVRMAALPSLTEVSEILKSAGASLPVSRSAAGTSSLVSPKSSAAQVTSAPTGTPPMAKRAPESRSAPSRPPELEEDEQREAVVFNPSWVEFVNFVKARSEIILATFLRRVSPGRFVSGHLEIKASPFDLASLKDSATIESLRECLHVYSGLKEWKILFVEGEAADKPGGEKPLPGSVAANEVAATNKRSEDIKKEALSSPLVESALKKFEGSKVQGVSIRKE